MSYSIDSITRRGLLAPLAVTVVAALSGCGGSSATPHVLSVGGHAATSDAGRATELHAAAQCIREHGIPSFPDPVLTASGRVYFDLRSIQDASQGAEEEAQQACAGLAARASFNPGSEPPAPPQLVAAGVAAAHCLRAHGLTNYRDPTSSTMYVPGHGFSLTRDEVPPGGKADPIFQQAAHACGLELHAEIQASTLSSLGHD
jgi:hypothetical protein